MLQKSLLLVGMSLLVAFVGCDNVDITQVQQILNPAKPVGEFEGEWWLELSTITAFTQPTTEEREDGTYIVGGAGLHPNGKGTLTFADGTVLKLVGISRWDEGALVQRIAEVDPDTGAPLLTIMTGVFAWEVHSPTGELIFLGSGTIQERHYTWQDGVTVGVLDVQPLVLKGTGVGLYEGYSIREETIGAVEVRDGVPGMAFTGSGRIEKVQ